MKVCKKCGFENLDDANFCANCQNDLNLEGGEILNKNAQDVSSSVNEAQEKIQVNTPLNDLRRQKSIMGLTLAAFFAQGMISGKINYNFPNSYRLYPNWEVFALTQWKLIR